MAGLFDIFSSKPAQNAAAANSAGIMQGRDDAISFLDEGMGRAQKNYAAAEVPFSWLFKQGTRGYTDYQDATGVNGAAGVQRATDTFTSLPGYQEGIRMSLDENDRRAASRGMLGSGNTIADTTKLATDYASQKYNDYLSALAPNLGVAQTAATGKSTVRSNLGNVFANIGSKKADVAYKAGVGTGAANAQGELADYGASKNMWDAIMGGVNLATKFMPG